MKRLILPILLLAISFISFAQKDFINLNFEQAKGGMPVSWENFGQGKQTIGLDSIVMKNGKYSAYIENFTNEKGNVFRAWALKLPANYAGKKIKLTGYIKTEKVNGGFAGLWMRIDPQIGFDNMQKRGIQGTADWKQYEIKLNMEPEKTAQIYIGGLLTGNGKMWLDDLSVTIDGKDISDAVVFKKKIGKADKDTAFKKGSMISRLSSDKKSIENLRVLGVIWGFLKYYHPNIAQGNYNWDYELFRILPKIQNVKTVLERDNILLKWIEGLGGFDINKKASAISDSVKIKPDLDWISTSSFSKELTSLLLNIQSAKRTEEHYYIDLFPNVANPVFKNEDPYENMKFPDAGYRLLSLYRYWNMIQYYFPYKNLIGEDWKKVLPEFLPVFINAENERDYTLAVLKLIARIHDTHANLWSSRKAISDLFGERFAMPEIMFAEGKAVVKGFYNDSIGKETGLKIGDIVTKVNGKPVEDIIKDMLPLTPASNYATQLRDIAYRILATNDSTIHIEFARDNKVWKRV